MENVNKVASSSQFPEVYMSVVQVQHKKYTCNHGHIRHVATQYRVLGGLRQEDAIDTR